MSKYCSCGCGMEIMSFTTLADYQEHLAIQARTIDMTMKMFAPGTKILIEVVFPGEYRIGWMHGNRVYTPGFGSYYTLSEALQKCLECYEKEFRE